MTIVVLLCGDLPSPIPDDITDSPVAKLSW